MKEVITAIIVMRILIQFVSQAVGIIAWHYRKPDEPRPFKMPFFPVPAVLSIIIWLFIFFASGWAYIAFAIGIIAVGLVLFRVKERIVKRRVEGGKSQ